MIIRVKVKPSSPKALITKKDEKNYLVEVTSEPENNKANRELITILADFFKTSTRNIKIVKGFKSKNKVVKIEETIENAGLNKPDEK